MNEKRSWNPLVIVLGLSAVFFVLFIAVSAALFFSGGRKGPAAKPGIFGGGGVGIVELKGVIMDSRKVVKRLEKMDEDKDVKAVVLRIDSPGGSVAPSQEIHEAVKRFKKPIVVSMASVAASGGYYVAVGAKKIYANPGSITGSIGVIMEMANLEKLYEWAKIKRYAIKTGKFKGMGAEYKELTPEERALLQNMIDDVLVQFKTAVAEGRKMKMEEVDAVADGRIFSGSQAKKARLIDEVGTMQDAIDEAARMAQIKGKPRVIYPDKPRQRLLQYLLDDRDPEDPEVVSRGLSGWVSQILGFSSDSRSLEERVTGITPGVYYLWNGAR